MGNLIDVSVIIVNYNTYELTKNCIESIKKQTEGINYEIIVVDNGSSDCSKDRFSINNDINYLYYQYNLGFGKANNLGVKYAKGKYLFFLNSDTILKNNAIKIFYDFAEKTGFKLGALGCILTDIKCNNIHSYGYFINIRNEIKTLISKYLRFLKNKQITNPKTINAPIKVDYITGADLFVPNKVFQEIGGFDSRFFMYCEETDLEQRMANQGYDRIIIPGPEIIHLEGGSDNDGKKIWKSSRMIRNRNSKIVYFKKYYKGIKLFFLRTFNYIMEFPITIYLIMRFPGRGYSSLLKIY